jgi:hypothetical protein
MEHSAYAQKRATVRFSFDVSLVLPPAAAIEHFTPEGERKWATGWNPTYLNTSDIGQVGTGTVFTTNAHGIRRVWIIDNYDSNTGLIRYSVLTADKHITRIEVRVLPRANGSIARITYERTSLSASADAKVRFFARHAGQMQTQWQSAIDALQTRC